MAPAIFSGHMSREADLIRSDHRIPHFYSGMRHSPLTYHYLDDAYQGLMMGRSIMRSCIMGFPSVLIITDVISFEGFSCGFMTPFTK